MHMQQGIGRAGYLLLAFAALTFGLFGLALTWVAFSAGEWMFFQMGAGVAGIALLALFIFAASGTRSGAAPARTRVDTPPSTPPTPPARAPKAGLDFEFKDYEPAPRAAPTELVVPTAFQDTMPPAPQHTAPQHVAAGPVEFQVRGGRDPAQWPQTRGKSSWTVQQEHRQKVREQVDESARRQQFADRYTTATPTVRNILQRPAPAPSVPEQIAERAPRDMNTDFVAPGMSVGQCGQCQTLLLAPETRPLRLKCPECAKVTLLQ